METVMHRSAFHLLCFIGGAMALATPALSLPSAGANDPALRLPQSQLRPVQQCWQRMGPFATQDTAWARWRQAQGLGLSVSNGVVPCWDGGARGYCFNVFHAC